MSFNKSKISTKLGIAFGVMVLLLMMLGGLMLSMTANIERSVLDIADRRTPIIKDLGNLRDEINLQARLTRNMVIFTEQAAIEQAGQRIASSRQTVTEILKRLDELILSEEGRNLEAKIIELRGKFRDSTDHFLEAVKQGNRDEAVKILTNDVRPIQEPYFAAIEAQSKFQYVKLRQSEEQAASAISTMKITTVGVVLTAVVVASLMALIIIRSITTPIQRSIEIARAVAAGDLRSQIDTEGTNETAQLLQALNNMQQGLQEVVGQVRSSCESVSTASHEIAKGNQDLSSRTESQASALEETAASMEELGSTVRQNADNARMANQLAQSASTVAGQGGEVVARVVETMEKISTSSNKIAEIIGVIDGIAFQTNILALNAAVEAARAGEQGRGFAVVASEVRSLASRSAEAAKEIKSLINASVEQVQGGSQLVDQAGLTMQEVVTSIRRVTDIMGEISAASSEQSSGVAQVGEAVTQMDQATQQNAAMVEEMAAAAAGLNTQANELVQAVSIFQLPGQSGQARLGSPNSRLLLS